MRGAVQTFIQQAYHDNNRTKANVLQHPDCGMPGSHFKIGFDEVNLYH